MAAHGGGHGKVKTITSERHFDDELAAASGRLVVVDFTAEWCGPCRMISPEVARLSESPEFVHVVFLSVDVDEIEEVARRYSIRAMPTFVFVKGSEVVAEFSGANAAQLKATVAEHAGRALAMATGGRKLGSAAGDGGGAMTPAARQQRARLYSSDDFALGNSGDCSLQIRLTDGTVVTGRFECKATIADVYSFLHRRTGLEAGTFRLKCLAPRRTYGDAELHLTLKDADLVPRAALILAML